MCSLRHTFPETRGATTHLAQELLTLINSNFIKHMHKFIAFTNNKTNKQKKNALQNKYMKKALQTNNSNTCVSVSVIVCTAHAAFICAAIDPRSVFPFAKFIKLRNPMTDFWEFIMNLIVHSKLHFRAYVCMLVRLCALCIYV